MPLDACIETMRQTGADMSEKYKETSTGAWPLTSWSAEFLTGFLADGKAEMVRSDSVAA